MYMVLNLGLKSIRAIIFDDQFKIISSSAKPLTTFIDNITVEQSADEWWSKALDVINRSLSELNRSEKIRGLTVTASSCCVVPVDSDGLPLSRVIMVSDKRAEAQDKKIKSLKSYKDLVEKDNIIPSNSTLMLPKILWFRENAPEIAGSTSHYLSPNDYFIKRLCGVAVTDALNAEKCAFDVKNNNYAEALLSDLDIPFSKLPTVVSPGTIVGKIKNSDMPSELQDVDIAVSTYDAICAFVGSGPAQKGDACDVSGTVTSLRVLADPDDEVGLSSKVFSQKEDSLGIMIRGASNNLGGGLVEWCKQAFYDSSPDAYGIMEAEAISRKENNNDPIFLPYLMGERAPLWNENARGVFFGLSRHHRRPNMTRAVFESAAFSLKQLCDEVESLTKVNAVSVSGGLARLNTINQMKADVLNKEIKVLSEFETTAIGAYVYLLKADGRDITLQDVKSSTKIRQIIIPDADRHEMYLERFNLFKSVYNNLISDFDLLASMEKKSVFQTKETVENM